jgi:hypothetical protein
MQKGIFRSCEPQIAQVKPKLLKFVENVLESHIMPRRLKRPHQWDAIEFDKS